VGSVWYEHDWEAVPATLVRGTIYAIDVSGRGVQPLRASKEQQGSVGVPQALLYAMEGGFA
jgi:hypothetical protein